MESFYEHLARLASTYASRIYAGAPLAEHEALCYMQVCAALEAFARFQAAAWSMNARNMEKQLEAEQAKEDS